jgi:arylsulfatase A-like enzyme
MRRIGLAVLIVLAACGRAAEAPTPRNAILIVVDTLRADHLGVYGYPRDTSPAIDAFAEANLLFERSRSQAPCTVPSVNSLLTSRHPLRFQGARKETLRMPLGIPKRFPSLAELLGRHGLSTAAVSASPVVRKTPTAHNREGGFDRGFDHFDERCLWADAACVHESALELLDTLSEPFFLYLHYMDPHGPYQPPESHLRRFATRPPGRAFVAAGDPKPIGKMLYAKGPEVEMAPADWQHLIDLYDDEILYFDGWFQALLDELDERGLADTTVLVLTSDHGEEFLDHGDVEHCRSLYDSEIRTPLVMRIPGVKGGRRIEADVQNLDIVPTLLDWLGLSTPGVDFDGRSLRPRVEGIEGSSDESTPSLAAWNTWTSLTEGDLKLIVESVSGRTELYDLSDDPSERRDLSTERAEDAARLSSQLSGELDRRSIVPPGPAAAAAFQDRLRALGYLE